MKIRFWGVRGSIPTPLKSAEIESKIAQAIHLLPPGLDTSDEIAVRAFVGALPPLVRGSAGGNTSCVEVRSGDTIVIIDAGSGLRELGFELMKGPAGRGKATIHFLFSHPHWDHVQGFPFFVPAFIPGNKLIFHGVHDLLAAFQMQQHPLMFPISLDYMRSQKEFVTLDPSQELTIDHLNISLMLNAHPGDSYSYRISDRHSVFVYASDAEYKDLDEESLRPKINFFRGANALVFDAQYTLQEAWQKVDWGHSSAMIGCDLARAAGVKRLLLYHHDPTYSDARLEAIRADAVAYQAQDDTRAPCEVIIAREGLELDLAPPNSFDVQVDDEGDAVLTVTSLFDQQGVDQIGVQLKQVEKGTAFLDLSRVETLTTAGLQALMNLGRERGSPPALVNPSAEVMQVLKLSGYSDVFAVYASVEEARAASKLRESLNLPGHLLNRRYRIEAEIGANRLGTTLRATDTHTGRPVAIKIINQNYSPETIDKLTRQAPHLMRLRHRGLRRVIAVEQDAGTTFIVSEWFDQVHNLDRRLFTGMLPLEEARNIAIAVAEALYYLHTHGVVHGDVQPHNVFLTNGGVRLSNVGMGKLEEGRRLLTTPLLLVNPSYVAPEQVLGQPIDARTDLYALGVILYELFVGRPPFTGHEWATMEAHLRVAPTPPRQVNPALSRGLEHLILKLLGKTPGERYTDARQVMLILESLALSRDDLVRNRYWPLAGRDMQLTTLSMAWEQAKTGQGRLMLISGEGGVGKTSLAREAALRSGNPIILSGHAEGQPMGAAYRVFREALESFFASNPPELRAAELQSDLAALAQIVPMLRGLCPNLPRLSPLEPRLERLRLTAALVHVVKQASAREPWLMILDDLHWADEGSLDLLRALVRRIDQCAILVIATYRDADIAPDHFLRDALREWRRSPMVRHFQLEPINLAATQNLLGSLWQRVVPDDLAQLIFRHTGGNPFYIEVVARGLVDDGLVTPDGESPLPDPSEIRLPQTVRDAVWRRIRYLNPDTQTVLRHASVLGQVFDFGILCAMSEASEAEVSMMLDAALERQLVRETVIPGQMQFTHAEVQYVLYADLGTLRRQKLHGEAAIAIAEIIGEEREWLADQLSYHFEEAGNLLQALDYSVMAAKSAARVHANAAALRLYYKALGLVDLLGPDEAPLRYGVLLDIYEALGRLLDLMGQRNEAATIAQQALVLAEALEDRAARARFHALLADLLYAQGSFAEADDYLDAAMAGFEEIDDLSGMASAHRRRAMVMIQRGDFSAADAFLSTSLDLRVELEQFAQAGQIALDLALLARRRGEAARTEGWYGEAIDLARRGNDLSTTAQAYIGLGRLAAERGNFDVALEQLEAGLAEGQAAGDLERVAIALHLLGNTHRDMGDSTTAVLLYTQSLMLYRDLSDLVRMVGMLEDLALLACANERTEAAVRLAAAAGMARERLGRGSGENERLRRELNLMTSQISPSDLQHWQTSGKELELDSAINEGLRL